MLELRNFKQIVKSKATGTPQQVYYICALTATARIHARCDRVYSIFTLRGAFSVARFDNLGNAKASTRGTGSRTGSTLFRIYIPIIDFISIQGVGG